MYAINEINHVLERLKKAGFDDTPLSFSLHRATAAETLLLCMRCVCIGV